MTLDITHHSPLCPAICGSAALAAEARKFHINGPKCQELGWSCTPLAVETYGNWVKKAHDTISPGAASRLATDQSFPNSTVMAEIYGRLNMVLIHPIARAILPVHSLIPGPILTLKLRGKKKNFRPRNFNIK